MDTKSQKVDTKRTNWRKPSKRSALNILPPTNLVQFSLKPSRFFSSFVKACDAFAVDLDFPIAEIDSKMSQKLVENFYR